MFRDLETKRLLLRGVCPGDRDFIFRQFSDPDVTRFLYDEEPFADIAEADGLIAFYTAPEPRAQHRWVLTRKDTGERVGTCGFHAWDAARGYAEIGYDLAPRFRGRGLMTEALQAALRFAREDMRLRKIALHIAPENARSLALAERLGFEKTPETVEYRFRGVDIPHVVYALYLYPSETK